MNWSSFSNSSTSSSSPLDLRALFLDGIFDCFENPRLEEVVDLVPKDSWVLQDVDDTNPIGELIWETSTPVEITQPLENAVDINRQEDASKESQPDKMSSVGPPRSKKETTLNSIVRKNRKQYLCQYCGRISKDSHSLKVHVMVHTGEKPFVCTLCEKPFRQKAHLTKHYQTHVPRYKSI